MFNRSQMLGVVLGLVLGVISLLAVEYFTLRERLVDELREQASIISENSLASLLFMDEVSAKQVLKTLSSSPDIDAAALYAKDGRLFAQYLLKGNVLSHQNPVKSSLMSPRQQLNSTEIWQIIFSEGEVVGVIYIKANLKQLHQQLLWYFLTTALVLIATVSVAYVIFRKLQKAVELAEKRVDFVKGYDPITNLSNRHAFNQAFHKRLLTASEKNEKLGLLLMDLDSFRVINDSLGHHIGDHVLRMVTQRLQLTLSKGEVIYRVGGDEFAMIVEPLDHLDQPTRMQFLISQFVMALSQPFDLYAERVYLGLSAGASIYPQHGTDTMTLFKAADAALYRAKKLGKNQFQIFSPEMHENSKTRLTLETELREALQKKQFELHYQPQVDLMTGELIGAEALVRWRHPERGLVSPLSFIPIAEETGLIIGIGAWVMRTACEQLHDWQSAGLKPIRVSVNLSGYQFSDPSLLDAIADILLETDINPDQLEIEITESVLMDNVEDTINRLKGIRSMGVHLAIDDFGTGYSSLSYLKRFPVERIKIDRSFVQDIPGDSDDVAITEATINMAKGLRIEVVAEGVETTDQVNFLREHRCQIAQGYYFSKPVEAKQMTEIIKTGRFEIA